MLTEPLGHEKQPNCKARAVTGRQLARGARAWNGLSISSARQSEWWH